MGIINEINVSQETIPEDMIAAGYRHSIDAANLAKSNRQHLDWGRKLGNPRKEEQIQKRLNINDFAQLDKAARLNGINKKAMWTIEFENLEQMGYTPFGAYFYKGIRDSIPTKPIVSNTDVLILHENQAINSEMMAAIYVWVNEQIISSFETNEISNYGDVAYFLRDLKQKGINIPKNVWRENVSYSDVESEFEELDILTGYVDEIPFNHTSLKDHLIETFPEQADVLEQYPNEYFSYLIRMQLGETTSKYLSQNLNTLMMRCNGYAHDYGWSKLLKYDDGIHNIVVESNNPTERLLNEINILSSTRIRKQGLNEKDLFVTNDEENILNKKHFNTVERTGYDWISDNHISALNLADDFGIDGIQWGASVNAKNERQEWLNLSYESLMDLSYALNIDSKEVSLSLGEKQNHLGLAFGSQGLKNAKAHYDPSLHLLHLSRLDGVGSFAHEWTHAYDRHLYQKALEKSLFPTDILFNANGSYFKALKNYCVKYDENHENYQQIHDFDPHLMQLIKEIWQPMPVILKNDDESIKFVNNFENYDYRESTLSEVDTLFHDTLQKYKKIASILKNTFFMPLDDNNLFLKNNWETCQFVLERLLPDYDFNQLIQIAPNGTVNIDNLMLPENRDKIFNELADKLENYRLNIINNEKLMDLRTQFTQELMKTESSYGVDFIKNNKDLIKDVTIKHLGNDKSQPLNLIQIQANIMRELSPKIQDIQEKMVIGLVQNTHKVFETTDNYLSDSYGLTIMANLPKLNLMAKDLISYRLTQEIHKVAIENNYQVTIGKKTSQLLSNSLKRDNSQTKHYYAKPEEIFARLGETMIGKTLENNNMRNIFLTNALEKSDTYHQYNMTNPYPMGVEAEKMGVLLKQSLNNHFKPFNLSLDNIPIIENEYSLKSDSDVEKNHKKQIKLA